MFVARSIALVGLLPLSAVIAGNSECPDPPIETEEHAICWGSAELRAQEPTDWGEYNLERIEQKGDSWFLFFRSDRIQGGPIISFEANSGYFHQYQGMPKHSGESDT